MQHKLILFDIDGTLLLIDTLADLAFRAMTKEVYGLESTFKDISYAGKTDPKILEEVLTLHGFDSATIWARYDASVEKYCTYFDYYAKQNSYQVTIYPGVIPLITELQKMPEMHLAILTGNLEYTGWRKLELAGLKHYFTFGAFGSDSKVRSELVGVAVKRAVENCGVIFSGKDIVIIGDSPHDVECGKPYGATSIAVATGHNNLEELKRHGPDYAFKDLRDYEKVIEVLIK
jgi:phosphoglycolate phosphatase-like HAD superfamily hydrolase